MERKSHISESELMDFFNDSLSVEEKQVILDWKELSEENRRLFEKVRKENLLLKEVVRAKLLRGDYSAIRARIGRRRRRVVRWTYRVAAIAAVAVRCGVILLTRNRKPWPGSALPPVPPSWNCPMANVIIWRVAKSFLPRKKGSGGLSTAEKWCMIKSRKQTDCLGKNHLFTIKLRFPGGPVFIMSDFMTGV